MKLFGAGRNDLEIIAGITSGSLSRRLYENQLYRKYRYLIKEGVFRHRLSEDESSIVYSDSIMSVIESIEKGVFEKRSSLKTYIHRIFANKCVDQIRKNTTNKAKVHGGDSVDDLLNKLEDSTRSAIEILIEQQNADALWRCLMELGNKCQQMIRSWSEGMTDREIAMDMAYQSAEVVKTSRLRCLDKLRSIYLGRFH